jgi:hypothetical protein
MRKLICAGALVGLALGFVGCGGGGSSPSEPTVPVQRGNWVGTITGVHAGIHLNGTCPLEMRLDPLYQGQWWVDCPGASSTGQVFGITLDNLLVLNLVTTSPLSSCPWDAVTTVTASTIDGTFEVANCANNQVVSTGSVTLRRR